MISSNIFRAQDEPKYTLALAISAAFGGVSMLLTVIYGVYMRSVNKLRNSRQQVNLQAKDVDTAILKEGSRNPTFRWMY